MHHGLYNKLEAARNAGFTAVDLYGDDWEQFKKAFAAASSLPPSTFDGDHTSVEAAKEVKRMCDRLGLKLLCLQPFRDFEGRLDPNEANERMQAARGTLSLLPHMGTDMLVIPSSTLPAHKISKDKHLLSTELGRLADYARTYSPPLRVCYEALSWGTHISTWRDAWEVVRLGNRVNLGLCLDSFNTAARQWADPFQPNGKLNSHVDEDLRQDMLELVKIVPAHKIFYFQIADGKFMHPPLTPPSDPEEPRLRPWSRGFRLFP
jgi:4-hydroxyphenylpyruvate dioxygenase